MTKYPMSKIGPRLDAQTRNSPMRFAALFLMLSALLGTTPAEARSFLHLYGSTTPQNAGGNGCSWNWNQDFFVPRHSTSCRYGLFSSCQAPRTTSSSACRWCHRFFPGYCSVYGACHYAWRNRVYRIRCGCSPVGTRCGGTSGCSTGILLGGEPPFVSLLPNVDLGGFEILGSIPSEEDSLTTGLGLGGIDGIGASLPGLPGAAQSAPPQSIPIFNLQQLQQLTQPLPIPAGP